MSLAELTRNCFQSGISASKWLSLCKLLISKESSISRVPDDIEINLSNSVLVLYRSYPGDPDLQEYLKAAIQDGTLSVATFVATLLQAARSPELHTAATLDTLCRIALDAHYSSGLPPIGSVVRYEESPITILGTVQDALALLRTAHSLPMTHFHQLTTSAAELVILLLSCVSDISQVSTAQAMVHFADANDLLHNFRLAPDVRQVLETFVLSLSFLIGDDAKAAREAQIMHSIQLALGKGDIHGSGSDTDITTFSLMLHRLVSYRAEAFGSGDGPGTVALLMTLFRWASWSPTVFYTQAFLSALTCMEQSSSNALVWKAFVVGRLPHLLAQFESSVNADGVGNSDWRRATQAALTAVSRHSELISHCDNIITRTKTFNAMQDEDVTPSIFRDLLRTMVRTELVGLSFAVELDPSVSSEDPHRLRGEAQDAGVDFEVYLESKIMPDIAIEDLRSFLDRLWMDVGSHHDFANVAIRRFISLADAYDVEGLSHLCKLFFTFEPILDVMALHTKVSDLLCRALLLLDQYDCETVGDPQTAVSHLGDVVLFLQYTTSRFRIDKVPFAPENRSFSSQFLHMTDATHAAERLSGEDGPAFNAWFKALFDSSSEGIEDSILRSTQPKVLLRISATLFSQAIRACLVQKIDRDVLNNGVSYFTGPLLNWTLVGVIKGLVREIQQRGFSAPTHLEILQTLLLSPACPRPVLSLCGPQLLLLFSDKTAKAKLSGIDITSVRRVVNQALNRSTEGNISEIRPAVSRIPREEEPKHAIQVVLALARAGKAPSFDVERCIKIMPPTKFLQLLWSELVISASLGEMDICRRIATFVLTTPRSSSMPPLLPIFLHIISPSLIFAIDHQQPPEHTMNVELLVTVVSSALTAALHLELAMHSVTGDHGYMLGQPSSGMARRFATELRSRQNNRTSRAIAQRLASSQSFVANFPVFMSELG